MTRVMAGLVCAFLCSCTARPQLIPITYDEWVRARTDMAPDIVVVDFWATWCPPCLERFPRMVALHRRYAGEGVRFVSVSLDDRDDAPSLAKAGRFLEEQGATFENYRLDENLLDAFEKLDILAIPVVRLYGRDGRLRMNLTVDDPDDQFTDDDVEAAIRVVLAEDTGREGSLPR